MKCYYFTLYFPQNLTRKRTTEDPNEFMCRSYHVEYSLLGWCWTYKTNRERSMSSCGIPTPIFLLVSVQLECYWRVSFDQRIGIPNENRYHELCHEIITNRMGWADVSYYWWIHLGYFLSGNMFSLEQLILSSYFYLEYFYR